MRAVLTERLSPAVLRDLHRRPGELDRATTTALFVRDKLTADALRTHVEREPSVSRGGSG